MSVALGRYWRSRLMGREGVDRMRQAVELARRWRTMASPMPDADRTMLVARVEVGLELIAGSSGWHAGDSLADDVVSIARESGDPALLVDALVVTVQEQMMRHGGPRTGAQRAMAYEALEVATRLDDPARLTNAQTAVAMLEAAADPVAAVGWLELATESAGRSGSPWAIGVAFQMRGRVAAQIDRLVDAQGFFREAQARFEEVGDTRFSLSAQSEHAHALRRAGAIDEADAEYRQTIRGWQRTGNRGAVANQLESLAFTALAKGDVARATRLLGAAEALREQSGDPMTAHERVEYDADVDRLRGDLDPAAFGAAWAEGRRLTAGAAVALAVAGEPPVAAR